MKTKSKSAKLSNVVLQMKFMKKTVVQEQEEQALAEQKKLVDEEHWYLHVKDKKSESNVGSLIVEPSYAILDGLVFGRFSFNGYNQQIEKLMNNDKEKIEESDNEKEIDDDEMAEKFRENSVNTTLHKKFSKNRFFKMKETKVKRLSANV